MDSEQFIEQYLLKEVQLIEAANVRLHLLAAMTHGVETAGALLDGKPFKSKGQGRKRFQLALKKLFPKAYMEANMKIDLYGQLRSHMSHCMLPANSISVNSSPEQHLLITENGIQFSLTVFFTDYVVAMETLLEMLRSGALKNKRITYDSLDGFQ